MAESVLDVLHCTVVSMRRDGIWQSQCLTCCIVRWSQCEEMAESVLDVLHCTVVSMRRDGRVSV